MTSSSAEDVFLPAQTPSEVFARIYSLTGAERTRTRGEKRALVALRDALGLEIGLETTNAAAGRRIASALDVDWRAPEYELRNTITLSGMNALLEGATRAYRQGALRQLEGNRPAGLTSQEWSDFQPAQSKIEAVNRISALTGSGAEWLGPGSKEHKRVLINLANHLAPDVDTQLSKTALAEALATEFGAPWSDQCVSTGYTISLDGLNTLLAGAERRLGRMGATRALLMGTPEEEGTALAAALIDGWRPPAGERRVIWDGRRSINWMTEQGIRSAINQMEWAGWYYEFKGREILGSAFAPNPNPPPVRYGTTTFDYSLRFVWDLKAHTERQQLPVSGLVRRGRNDAPLNDVRAMDACIADQGLGFLMVSGVAVMDEDGRFARWHRDFKAAQGIRTARSNSGRSRNRKAAFVPLCVEAFWFPNTASLDHARASGTVPGFAQGPQAPRTEGEQGRLRPPKYKLNVRRARASELAIARFDWPITDD